MKNKNKMLSYIAAALFFYIAFRRGRYFIPHWFNGNWIYMIHTTPFYLILYSSGLIIVTIMGIKALRQKKRGKLLNTLAILYIIAEVVNVILTTGYRGLGFAGLVVPALVLAGFLMSGKGADGAIFDTKDTLSSQAKAKAQTNAQQALYRQQLQDGILTQEEYKQLEKKQG